MRAIFISYRREDAEGQAGRLFDDLVAHFGAERVFMDVAGIEPGEDFRKVIDQHLAKCGVLLALIGKHWVDLKDVQGQRRLDDPLDFVRLETASALKRDIPVIPVLVQNASMPSAQQLPSELADLAYRNGTELTHARWDSDVKWLIKALSAHITPAKQKAVAEYASSIDSHPSRRMPLLAIAVASAVAIALSIFSEPNRTNQFRDASYDDAPDAITGALAADRSIATVVPAKVPSKNLEQAASRGQINGCALGYVERRAYKGDSVCVLHSSAARAVEDNRDARARWQTGAYGDTTCRAGYVWRAASPDDVKLNEPLSTSAACLTR